MGKTVILGFIAGFMAVLLFHQGTAFLLHHLSNAVPAMTGVFGRPPFKLAPVPPLGVPAVASAAFWGGVWGVVLAALLRWTRCRTCCPARCSAPSW